MNALKLENQLCFPLYVAAKEVVSQYKPLLDQLGLTYTQYIAMLVLWDHKTISVKELGGYLHLDSGTLSPLLKRLESKGYVRRTRLADDERVVQIAITPAGEELKTSAQTIPGQIADCLPLTNEEGKTLYQLLYKLIDSLNCNQTRS